jgi:hypothetical protein
MSLGVLRQLAHEGALRPFFESPPGVLAGPGRMTGAHLKIDEFALGRLRELLPPPAEIQQNPLGAPYSRSIGARRLMQELEEAWLLQIIAGQLPPDSIPGWDRRCMEMRYDKDAKPFVVLIDLSPKSEPWLVQEAPRSYEGFPIRYRRAGPAEPHVGVSDEIRDAHGLPGTLGGWLEDAHTGELYAVTCEHVASIVGGGIRDKSGQIGVLAAATRSQLGPPCGMHAQPGAGVIDAALVKLDPNVQATLGQSLSATAMTAIGQADPVSFVGARSGHVTAEIACATIWKQIDFGVGPICFGDLFALQPRQRPYVVAPVSRPGDSGSWVLDDALANPVCRGWQGMLIAGDYQLSYVCYAEHVMSWANGFSSQLRPVP